MEAAVTDAAAEYRTRGYALVPRFIAPELGEALAGRYLAEMRAGRAQPNGTASLSLLTAPALHIFTRACPEMRGFHWGLTPAMEALAGCALLPTHALMRLYREGAICRVHRDRAACEHSLSLMLATSDALPWALDLESAATAPEDGERAEPDFGGNGYRALPMSAGDSVAYKGMAHRHGRVAPNPNRWSIHMFLHWVDRDGPCAGEAWAGEPPPPLKLA